MDKYKLIYQFNNDSPLFARIAEDYIVNSDYEKAMEIIEAGLKSFPDYISANFLYAICLANTMRVDEAKEFIEKAAYLLDDDETKEYYLNKINEIAAKLGLDTDRKNISFDEKKEFINTSDKNKENIDELNSENLTDELELLAKKLENAKIDLKQDDENIFLSEDITAIDENEAGKSLVSETLAKIYLSQGNYSEAMNLYKNLMEIQPERAQFYQSQLIYIQKIIDAEKK